MAAWFARFWRAVRSLLTKLFPFCKKKGKEFRRRRSTGSSLASPMIVVLPSSQRQEGEGRCSLAQRRGFLLTTVNIPSSNATMLKQDWACHEQERTRMLREEESNDLKMKKRRHSSFGGPSFFLTPEAENDLPEKDEVRLPTVSKRRRWRFALPLN